MTNIKEVAKIAGVSTATVSRTLSNPELVSEKTRKKVQEAIKAANYRPNMLARNLRSDKSHCILVLVPGITNPFFSQVLLGISRAAKRSPYSILLGDTRDNPEVEDEYFQLIETRLADGIIHLSPDPMKTQHVRLQSVPIVNACGCERTALPSIRIDNATAAKTVIEDFIKKGHRDIAILSGRKDNSHSIDRMKGVLSAFKEANLELNPKRVYYGDYFMKSGCEAGKDIVKEKKLPTALFSMNDQMAIGAIQTFQANGVRIPEDIIVAGFDNIEFSKYCNPPLTTIEQPAMELGAESFKTLMAIIDKEDYPKEEKILPFKYIRRQSTAENTN